MELNDKEYILDNVQNFKPEYLADAIKSGIVTFEELCRDTEGKFSKNARDIVWALLPKDEEYWKEVSARNTIEGFEKYLTLFPDGAHRQEAEWAIVKIKEDIIKQKEREKEQQVWAQVEKDSIEELRNFIAAYPNGCMVGKAKERLNYLLKKQGEHVTPEKLRDDIICSYDNSKLGNFSQRNTHICNSIRSFIQNNPASGYGDFLSLVRENHNLLSEQVAKKLIDDNILLIDDLKCRCGISDDFMEYLQDESRSVVNISANVDNLQKIMDKTSTEVYFWGIPSSGKTCVLGNLLSVASNGRGNGTMQYDPNCQGYGYMTNLVNHFRLDRIITLPESTPMTAFYEMSFDLSNINGDNKVHPITCIDMAGELMCAMYLKQAGEALNDEDQKMIQTMTNILVNNRTHSRKIHVFVIEYGGHDRLYRGKHADTFLNGSLDYLRGRQGLLEKDTDGIYILLTKADMCSEENRKSALSSYVKDRYKGFFDRLCEICKENEINQGNVPILPFSMGEICFQQFCKIDMAPAQNFINIVFGRTKGNRKNKLGKLFNGFRK